MYMSRLVGKTLKKYERDFTLPSQELIFRSGLFREIDNSLYGVLPLGAKLIDNIIEIIKTKMEENGFQRVYLPRENFIDDIILAIRNDIKSYRELPVYLYDVQTGERLDYKTREGLLGGKEFQQIRSCSFIEDGKGEETFKFVKNLFKDIIKDMGLDVIFVSDYNPYCVDGGRSLPLGEALVLPLEAGNRRIYYCSKCDRGTAEEVASFHIEEEIAEAGGTEEIYTPEIKTIKQLTDYLKVGDKAVVKTLLVKADEEVVAVVIRGDRELNKYKLSKALGVGIENIKMAEEDDIKDLNTVTGFVGPLGLKGVKIIIDREVAGGGPYIAGANKADYHIKNLIPKRDLQDFAVAEISYAKDGDRCPVCGEKLDVIKGFDIGGIYHIGNGIKAKNFDYKDMDGNTHSIQGLYSYVDIYRIISLIIHKNHDEFGIVWPLKLAPYKVLITVLNVKNEDKVKFAEGIYRDLQDMGVDVLLDDRNESIGVKFMDGDLMGIPIRIVVGKKADEKIVEYKLRNSTEKEELKVNEALGKVIKVLKGEGILDR